MVWWFRSSKGYDTHINAQRDMAGTMSPRSQKRYPHRETSSLSYCKSSLDAYPSLANPPERRRSLFCRGESLIIP